MRKCLDCGVIFEKPDDPAEQGCYAYRGFGHRTVVTYSRLHPLIQEMVDEDRAYDPWGACLGALGPICDVLFVQQANIPTSVGYSPAGGPGVTPNDLDLSVQPSGENEQADMLLRAMNLELYPDDFVDMDELTIGDLEYAVRVLDRYADLLKLAGKDY